MSVVYDEIFAAIVKKKFVEELKGTWIAAFRDNGLSLNQKHMLLYFIVDSYIAERRCHLNQFLGYILSPEGENVVKVLKQLILGADAEFLVGADNLKQTALDIDAKRGKKYSEIIGQVYSDLELEKKLALDINPGNFQKYSYIMSLSSLGFGGSTTSKICKVISDANGVLLDQQMSLLNQYCMSTTGAAIAATPAGAMPVNTAITLAGGSAGTLACAMSVTDSKSNTPN